MNALFARIMAAVRLGLTHIFTGSDNVTLAIGRVAAAPYLLVGWALPYVMMVTHQTFTLAEAGMFLAAHAAGVWPLVTGTASTEPPPKDDR